MNPMRLIAARILERLECVQPKAGKRRDNEAISLAVGAAMALETISHRHAGGANMFCMMIATRGAKFVTEFARGNGDEADAPRSHLSQEARELATALRDVRPAVLPNTNVIPYSEPRDAYYRLVTEAAMLLWPKNRAQDPKATAEFFDLCGIPD